MYYENTFRHYGYYIIARALSVCNFTMTCQNDQSTENKKIVYTRLLVVIATIFTLPRSES